PWDEVALLGREPSASAGRPLLGWLVPPYHAAPLPLGTIHFYPKRHRFLATRAAALWVYPSSLPASSLSRSENNCSVNSMKASPGRSPCADTLRKISIAASWRAAGGRASNAASNCC